MSIGPSNQKSNQPIRVVILDASRMGAQLLANALKGEQFQVVYGGSRVTEAIAATSQADIVLLAGATDQQCLQSCTLVPSFKTVSSSVRVILLADDPGRDVVIEAFKTGVRGIFSSTISVDDLRKCILSVVSGQVWASNRDVNHLLDALSFPPSMRLVDARGIELLSKREADVVRCVSDGLTNREIADQLRLSENTVKNYLFRIFDKLGVSTRVELIMYAIGNLAQQAAPETSKSSRTQGSPVAAAKQVIASLSLLEEIHRSARSASSDAENVYMWLVVAYELSTEMQMNIRAAASTLEKELSPRQKLQAERAAEQVLRERQESSPSTAQASPLPKAV